MRAMVTALKVVCVKFWNQNVKREPTCRRRPWQTQPPLMVRSDHLDKIPIRILQR